MDFSKLTPNDLAQFLLTDYSDHGLIKPIDYAKQVYDQLTEKGIDPPISVQDLLLAESYQGPHISKLTEWDILNGPHLDLARKLGIQDESEFGVSQDESEPTTLQDEPEPTTLQDEPEPTTLQDEPEHIIRQRILRIMGYMGCVYEQWELLVEPTILDKLNGYLSVHDFNHLRLALRVENFACRISVDDADGYISYIDGLNDSHFDLIYHIETYGSLQVLQQLILKEDLNAVKRLVEQNREILVNEKINSIYTTVLKGRYNWVPQLIEWGALINKSGEHGVTALLTAISKGHIDEVTMLIGLGADIDHPDWLTRFPLHYAADNMRPEITRLLLQRGANPNVVDHESRTPMAIACDKGDLESVDLLIDAGADINVGRSPILYAIQSKNKDLVNKLLDHPQINLVYGNGSIIHHLIDMDWIEEIKRVIQMNNESSNDINLLDYTNNNGHPPLSIAINRQLNFGENLEPIIQLLIESGSDTNLISDHTLCIMVNKLVEFDCLWLFEMLIEHGLDVNRRIDVRVGNRFRDSSLLGEVAHEYKTSHEPRLLTLARVLIDNGAQIFTDLREDIDSDGPIYLHQTPSSYAFWCLIHSINLDVAQFFIELKDSGIISPRFYCSRTSPVHGAIVGENYESARILIEHGFAVNLYTDDGISILHLLDYYQDIQIPLRMLLQHGADPNGVGSYRGRPINKATESGNLEAVKLLIEFGADHLKESNQLSPLEIAKKHKYSDIVAYLKSLS